VKTLLLTLIAGLSCSACYAPQVRLPLPATFPVISGATPVPGRSVGLSAELADGLRGPELGRGEVRGAGITVGLDDRFSLGYVYQETSDVDSGVTLHVGVHHGRVKMRLGQLFGPTSEVAVHAAFGSSEHVVPGVQDDGLHTWDLAVPVELLLSGRPGAGGGAARASVFLGPRIVLEQYDDRVRPDQSFHIVLPGVVGGFHLSAGHLELFIESTLAAVPRNSYLGVPSGGKLMVMPAFGAQLRLGAPFDWAGHDGR